MVFNTYFQKMKVLPVTRQIIQSDYLQYCHHNTNIPIRLNVPFNEIYFRNNKIKPVII